MLAPLTAEQNEIFDLRDKVHDLQETITTLRAALTPCSLRMAEQGRTGTARALSCLLSSPDGFRSRGHLLAAISFTAARTDPKLVDVTICRLRHQLPEGASIKTIRGAGYCLTPGSREIIEGEHGRPNPVYPQGPETQAGFA